MTNERIEPPQACAKLILCGEHFVLNNAPAIAMPLESLRLLLEPAQKPGGDPVLARAWNTARTAAGLGKADGFPFAIRSAIPRGVGLGSSAALAVAMVRAAAREAGLAADNDYTTAVATRIEDVFHGKSSGLDPAAVVAGCPVLRLADGTMQELSWGLKGIAILVGRVPTEGSTAEAVARTRNFAACSPKRFDSLLDEAHVLAGRLADAVEGRVPSSERIAGEVLSRFHRMLAETGVSCPSLDLMVESAESAGALGAKLTGAGLGGCALALVENGHEDAVQEAMIRSGALDVFRV
ncbi:MAG: hypothetical protein GXP54_09755 [Deltaproteobacteria bacterium]|nr:hypothetical protein [Deltaproteobacteria bacterium]